MRVLAIVLTAGETRTSSVIACCHLCDSGEVVDGRSLRLQDRNRRFCRTPPSSVVAGMPPTDADKRGKEDDEDEWEDAGDWQDEHESLVSGRKG